MNKKRTELRKFEAQNRITVGELRKQLEALPADMEIVFNDTVDGDIVMFYRTRLYGKNKFLIEFNIKFLQGW